MPEAHFRGGGGGVGVAPPLLGGAKFSETSFPHFQTYFMQIGDNYLYTTNIFKAIDSNNFALSLMVFVQNAWPIKYRRAVCTSVLLNIFIHFVTCENGIGSKLVHF